MSEKRFTTVSIGVEEAYCDFSIIKVGDKIISDRIPTLDAIGICDLLNEQQATIKELQSIINHIKCEENCGDYDYCCETVCSLYNEIKHLKEENEQLKEQLKGDNL